MLSPPFSSSLPTQTLCSLMLCSGSNTASDPSYRYSQSIPLVLWICQVYSNKTHWIYYCYKEDRNASQEAFAHTAALLERWAPLAQILVTREEPSNTAAQELVWSKLTAWCTENYNGSTTGSNTDFAPENSGNDDIDNDHNIVQHGDRVHIDDSHAAVSQQALARLEQTLQNALNAENVMTLAADLDFGNKTVRKAMMWTMEQTAGTPQQCITVTAGHLNSHLHLDRTAARAIHLWPEHSWGAAQHHSTSQSNASLLGVLSQPLYTAAGKRLLQAWLRQPLVDLPQIVTRQDAVELLVQRSVGRDAIRQAGLRLFQSADLTALIEFLVNQQQQNNDQGDNDNNINNTKKKQTVTTRKALQSLYQLYQVSSEKLPLLLEQVETALAQQDFGTTPQSSGTPNTTPTLLHDHVLMPLRQGHAQLQRSIQLCEAILDLDHAPREFLVHASYNDTLHDLHRELAAVQDECQQAHDEMNAAWEQLTGKADAVRLEQSSSSSDDNNKAEWQFRLLNTNDSKKLHEYQQQLGSSSSLSLQQITIHRVLKNGVYFSTKQLRQLASKQQDLRQQYDSHCQQVVMDALQVATSYTPCLAQVRDAVALLDVLCALAHTAAYSPRGTYCRPVMTDCDGNGGGIELKQARHPCVELQENMTEFIPNDVTLKFGESSFLLVTGPNMGGKSTYIRALGAIVTLAQIGSFVPCSAAQINICHHILARVGAGDLQERGISTFMAEMLESSSILRTATKRSLIIIDELGRGTSTFDGYGLARAISEYMCQKIGCMTVFATHFHELTALEGQEVCVQNCHVTARKDSQGLTFLYQVKPGPCLESFGIQVAEMAQVPAVVIEDAKRKAEELENFEYHAASTNRAVVAARQDTESQVSTAEESAAALAWINRFRRLPESVFSSEYRSNEEKRAVIIQRLEAS